jgi:hypothetical protein
LDVLLLEAVGFAAAAVGLRCEVGLAAGLVGAFGATAAGSTARMGSVAAGSGSTGAVPAMPMVLESVRWQVSQVMIVRTSAPS